MKSELIKGDSLQELKKYDDNSIDLLCTDPPYGYSFMGRDWDKTLPPKEIFEECFRVLKPGSMAFVMSAPRSDVQYRMAEMLEKVGFRIDYTPIYWTYASGFPKAMNIGKMIDKRQGNKREEVEDPQSAKRNKTKSDREVYGDYKDTNYKVTKGSSELEGSYGGFQPKPAVEVVLVAMKPIEEKGLLAQAQKNGKAVTWFDDCRIPFADESDFDSATFGTQTDIKNNNYGTNRPGDGHIHDSNVEANPIGRFPANLLVSDKVLDDGTEKKTKVSDYEKYMKDNVAGQMNFDEKYEKNSGKMYEGGWEKPKRKKKKMTMPDLRDVGKKSKEAIGIDKLSYGQVQNAERKEYEMWDIEETTNGYSRFFSLDNWFSKNIKQLPEPVQQTFPFMIVPKASKSEKNDGLDNFDTKQTTGGGGGVGDYIDDVNSASGKFGSEKAPSRNIHPTVKPLTLMNYLVVLGSRKGDVVLDPFMGSGTTPLACVSLERKYIGIDNEEDYYKIAKARVDKLERPLKMWEKFS